MKARSIHKTTILLVSLILILTMTIGGTLAILMTKSEKAYNSFFPKDLEIEIEEQKNGPVKEAVKIKNIGGVYAYVSAVVVITWQTEDGMIYSQLPVEGVDYTITDPDPKWLLHEGIYYWQEPLAPEQKTGDLIGKCEQLKDSQPPEGYYLSVEILSSAIQTEPKDIVEETWDGLYIDDNGNLAVKSPVSGGEEE